MKLSELLAEVGHLNLTCYAKSIVETPTTMTGAQWAKRLADSTIDVRFHIGHRRGNKAKHMSIWHQDRLFFLEDTYHAHR